MTAPTFLLILTLTAPGQPPADVPAGIFLSEDLCILAGQGMTRLLVEGAPGHQASWTCAKVEEMA